MIAGYLYKKTMNIEEAYKLLCYVTEDILIPNFSNDLSSILKLSYLCDKMIKKTSPRLWNHLYLNDCIALNYSVSVLLTLFTSWITNEDARHLVDRVWDLIIGKGFYSVITIMTHILLIQQPELLSIEGERLIMSLKLIDKDPLGVTKASDGGDLLYFPKLQELMTKERIFDMGVPDNLIDRLVERYKYLNQPFY